MDQPSDTSTQPSPFTIQVEQPEPCRRVMHVSVEPAAFDREYARLLRDAHKRAVRPGFRRGKVPLAVVERELANELKAKVLEDLIPLAYRQALIEHSLIPVSEPEVDKLSSEPGQPVTFDITVEVRPEIELRDYRDLPLRRRAAVVADGDVDGVVQRLRESRAIYERADRAAQTGDRLVLDIVPLKPDGSPDTERQVKDYAFEVGERGNIPAFDAALAGAEAGKKLDITVAYAEDHFNEALRGRTIIYRTDVKEVRRPLLPPADDAFAASLKPGQTLLELRVAIRSDLQREEEQTVRRELEEQALDLLIARNEVAVPPSLLERYLESGIKELHERNAQRHHPDSDEEDARYRELTRPLAERVIRSMFLLDALRRQERIAVSEVEVEARIEEIAGEYGFEVEQYRKYAAQGPERDRIARALEERRAFDFLLSHAQYTEAAAEGA